eukprot:c24134_g1_i1 orf=995-1438(+)
MLKLRNGYPASLIRNSYGGFLSIVSDLSSTKVKRTNKLRDQGTGRKTSNACRQMVVHVVDHHRKSEQVCKVYPHPASTEVSSQDLFLPTFKTILRAAGLQDPGKPKERCLGLRSFDIMRITKTVLEVSSQRWLKLFSRAAEDHLSKL